MKGLTGSLAVQWKFISVEIKAISALTGCEEAQVVNYLKATGLKVGLLINFAARSLEHKRFVYNLRESA
jgi:GxxExxY protein